MFVSLIPPHTPRPCLFFFNDTATTEIYTLSLHDALPIYGLLRRGNTVSIVSADDQTLSSTAVRIVAGQTTDIGTFDVGDRESTRPNSSNLAISHAVFCLKKNTASLFAVAFGGRGFALGLV